MGHKYLPQTDSDIAEMLSAAGVGTLQDLYADVPEALKLNKDYDLPSAMSEHEVRKTFALLLKKNKVLTCFAGGGVYDHYVPAVSDYITSRSEFLTSYTKPNFRKVLCNTYSSTKL
jgi:glycine dehydrogenase subunit 1